jgi:DUF2934 family protein
MISKEPSPRKRKPAGEKVSKENAAPTESAGIVDHAEVLRQLIAERAYELFERRTARGPMDDWLEAEREILGLSGVATH